MASFWILATLMTLVALAFVLVPLLRSRPGSGPSARDANLQVLRAQRREIDADVASGTLAAEARDQALAELVARANADLQAPADGDAAPARKPWAIAAVAAIAVPVLAFGMYLAVGSPGAVELKAVAKAEEGHDDARMAQMVDALALRMRERPDDAQGWSLLARSLASMGRYKEAAEAYEHLAKLMPGDPDVLADYADMLGMAQGRTLAGKPTELIRAALKIDPNHRKALALAGTLALDAGDYASARDHWARLAALLPAESAERAQVLAIVDEVQQRAAASGKPLPAMAPVAVAKAAPKSPGAKAPPIAGTATMPPGHPPIGTAAAPEGAPAVAQSGAGNGVSGSVTVAPAMAGQISGTDTLWVFARAESGPRVPLAVLRKTAAELPLQFALDDTLAMSPEMKISGAQAMRIEARISRSGNVTPQAGDVVGASAVVKPGARNVRVILDKVVP